MKNKKKTFFYALKNNFFMLKLTFAACPSRVAGNFITILLRYGIMGVFIQITFLETIVGYLETGAEFQRVVWFTLFTLLLLSICTGICIYYDRIIAPVGNQIMYEKLHLRMFEKAADVELECFENPEFYNKYTKATSQIKGKAFAVVKTMSDLTTILANLCFLTYKAVTTDIYVLFFVLLPVVSTYIIGIRTNKLRYRRYEAAVADNRRKDYVKRTMYLQDYAKEMRLSNIFNVLTDTFESAVSNLIRNIKTCGTKLVFLGALQSGLNYFVTIGCIICYAGLRLLYWKNISPADFVVLVSVISTFTWNVIDISANVSKIQDNSQYIENIKSFMNYEPKISESQPGLKPRLHQSALKMRDVSYTYLGQSAPVLKHINLKIEPGQKIALVGHNGAGKSTLVKLLMRLYDASEGTIMLGEHDIRDYQVKEYRRLFATVFQDYQVLSLTVAENVMMGNVGEAERETVAAALKNSGVYEKVQMLKHGMDTTLTREFDKDGAVLSGGETQKIAIARVYARDCDFVILDEPSSALDPIAEYQMYQTMLEACKDKAVIFISHRLSSAVLADYIYMLDKGAIIEEGTHQQLLEQNGTYAQMFRLQAASYR